MRRTLAVLTLGLLLLSPGGVSSVPIGSDDGEEAVASHTESHARHSEARHWASSGTPAVYHERDAHAHLNSDSPRPGASTALEGFRRGQARSATAGAHGTATGGASDQQPSSGASSSAQTEQSTAPSGSRVGNVWTGFVDWLGFGKRRDGEGDEQRAASGHAGQEDGGRAHQGLSPQHVEKRNAILGEGSEAMRDMSAYLSAKENRNQARSESDLRSLEDPPDEGPGQAARPEAKEAVGARGSGDHSQEAAEGESSEHPHPRGLGGGSVSGEAEDAAGGSTELSRDEVRKMVHAFAKLFGTLDRQVSAPPATGDEIRNHHQADGRRDGAAPANGKAFSQPRARSSAVATASSARGGFGLRSPRTGAVRFAAEHNFESDGDDPTFKRSLHTVQIRKGGAHAGDLSKARATSLLDSLTAWIGTVF
jgi:hypothetical protein